MTELKSKILDTDKVYFNIQEDWEFNEKIKNYIEDDNSMLEVDNKFECNHIRENNFSTEKDKSDVSVLMLTMRNKSVFKYLEEFTFNSEYILLDIENEHIDKMERTIETKRRTY